MGIYEDLKEEIHSNLLSQSKDRSNVLWNTVVSDMRSTILSRYNGTSIKAYKGAWKQAFKKAASQLSLSVGIDDREDVWNQLINQQINEKASVASESLTLESISSRSSSSRSSSSISSLLYQRKLLPVDYANLAKNHAKITDKWRLDSGRMVEDIMFEATKEFIVEHPAHSFILNMNDPKWKEQFTQSEFDEIKDSESIFEFDKPFPPELQEVVMKLDRKTNFRDIYDAIVDVKADPIDNPEKFWLKQSILNYVMLFIDSKVPSRSETEQDLLDDVYGFVKKSCRLSRTKAYGAKPSQAASEWRNSTRTIGSLSEVQRKQVAESADLTFRYVSQELFCLEVGLNDCGPNDTKEMNESSIKTPIMMRNFCAHFVSQYRMQPKNIKIMGIIISGLSITGLGMSFNNGSVSLLSTSKRLHMPEAVYEIPLRLPPVLNLIYNVNILLKSTVEEIERANSSVVLDLKKVFFPPCFIPAAATTNIRKRKTTESS